MMQYYNNLKETNERRFRIQDLVEKELFVLMSDNFGYHDNLNELVKNIVRFSVLNCTSNFTEIKNFNTVLADAYKHFSFRLAENYIPKVVIDDTMKSVTSLLAGINLNKI